MKKENKEAKASRKRLEKQTEQDLPGYPLYSTTEDIYNQWEKKSEINPADITKQKAPNEPPGSTNEKGFADNLVPLEQIL
jgi:hypothetical protein